TICSERQESRNNFKTGIGRQTRQSSQKTNEWPRCCVEEKKRSDYSSYYEGSVSAEMKHTSFPELPESGKITILEFILHEYSWLCSSAYANNHSAVTLALVCLILVSVIISTIP